MLKICSATPKEQTSNDATLRVNPNYIPRLNSKINKNYVSYEIFLKHGHFKEVDVAVVNDDNERCAIDSAKFVG